MQNKILFPSSIHWADQLLSIFAFLVPHVTFQDISQPLFWRINASVAESGSHGSTGWSFVLFYFSFGVSK